MTQIDEIAVTKESLWYIDNSLYSHIIPTIVNSFKQFFFQFF